MRQLSILHVVIWEMEEWYKRRQETDVEVTVANLIFTFNNKLVRLSRAIRNVIFSTLLSAGNPAGYLLKAHTLSYKWENPFR